MGTPWIDKINVKERLFSGQCSIIIFDMMIEKSYNKYSKVMIKVVIEREVTNKFGGINWIFY